MSYLLMRIARNISTKLAAEIMKASAISAWYCVWERSLLLKIFLPCRPAEKWPIKHIAAKISLVSGNT